MICVIGDFHFRVTLRGYLKVIARVFFLYCALKGRPEYTHARLDIRTHTWIYARTRTSMYNRIYICIYILYLYIVCARAFVCVYLYICMHMYVYVIGIYLCVHVCLVHNPTDYIL